MTWQKTDPTQRHESSADQWATGAQGCRLWLGPAWAISCADMHFDCVSSRGNSGFFYASAGKWALLSLASQTMLLLHAVRKAHITWLGSSISATQSFDYSKWAHYYISRSHKGYDCLVILSASLLFLQDRFCSKKKSVYNSKFQQSPWIYSHPAE